MQLTLTPFMRWLRTDFAEWWIGSWAMALGWSIAAAIFANLLIMDGHFSRGLGEGSGIDPGLFQHIGWSFRCFGAIFLVLSVKFEKSGLGATATKVKALGTFCTIIVILHATGFGLTALASKRDNANAVMQTVQVAAAGDDGTIAKLEAQQRNIRADRDKQVEVIQQNIYAILHDRDASNDHLAGEYRANQEAVSAAAQKRIDAIDTQITALTTRNADRQTGAVQAKSDAGLKKWSPLFVGLAQLFTWSKTPSDWSIYVVGVVFLVAWVLLADAIVIGLPSSLYKLHLRDKYLSKLKEAGAKGGTETAKRQREKMKRELIEHRQVAARRTTVENEGQPKAAKGHPGAIHEDGEGRSTVVDQPSNDDETPQQAAE